MDDEPRGSINLMLPSLRQDRFRWVVEGDRRGPNPLCDVDLWEDENAAAVPTMGSLVENWLLVIPRHLALSFAQLPAVIRNSCQGLIGTVADRVFIPEKRVYYFEHGPAQPKTVTGCGIDQAHVHVLPLAFDLIGSAIEYDEKILWRPVDAADPWRHIDRERDYYVVSDFERAYVGLPVEKQSQFFRRVIAQGIGRPSAWDFLANPFYENVTRTISNLRSRRSKHLGTGQQAA